VVHEQRRLVSHKRVLREKLENFAPILLDLRNQLHPLGFQEQSLIFEAEKLESQQILRLPAEDEVGLFLNQGQDVDKPHE
jgi:type IV secretory pathway VirD2 relaxase